MSRYAIEHLHLRTDYTQLNRYLLFIKEFVDLIIHLSITDRIDSIRIRY